MDRRRSRRPRSLVPFSLGLIAGFGVMAAAPALIGPLRTAFDQGSEELRSLGRPLAFGNRRILVLGSDEAGGNTDVMFTVEVKDGRTTILQVPRDTYIESERFGVLKANALVPYGGPSAAKDEITRLLEAPVDRYLKVNLQAVEKLADAIGGVEVDVERRLYYVDQTQGLYIDLYPGRQVLRGRDLEGFLRYRNDAEADIGRIARQRLVLAEVFRKLVQPATVTRLPELLSIAGDDIRTDLSAVEMAQLVAAMTATDLRTEQLPGYPYWLDDLSYWMPERHGYDL